MANNNGKNARTFRNGIQYFTLTVLIIHNLRNIFFPRNSQFKVEVQPKKVQLSWKQVKDKLGNRSKLVDSGLYSNHTIISKCRSIAEFHDSKTRM